MIKDLKLNIRTKKSRKHPEYHSGFHYIHGEFCVEFNPFMISACRRTLNNFGLVLAETVQTHIGVDQLEHGH